MEFLWASFLGVLGVDCGLGVFSLLRKIERPTSMRYLVPAYGMLLLLGTLCVILHGKVPILSWLLLQILVVGIFPYLFRKRFRTSLFGASLALSLSALTFLALYVADGSSYLNASVGLAGFLVGLLVSPVAVKNVPSA